MDILPIRFHEPADTPTISAPTALVPTKVDGLVTVRAVAALGVVLLHACVPYLQNPMPGLVWPVHDGSRFGVDCLFWGIEVVIMPVFLFVAGFLVWRSLHRSGPGKLIRSRARRLLLPLAFAMLVILPVEPFIWVLGFVTEGLVPVAKLKSLKIDGPLGEDFWGLSHLWFLPYLFLYVVVVAVGAMAVRRFRRVRLLLNGVMKTPAFVPLALIAIAAWAVFVRPDVVWGFQHAFLPVPSKWIYSGCFFLGGVRLGSQDWELRRLGHNARRLVPLALLLMAASVILGRWHLVQSPDHKTSHAYAGAALAVLTAGAAWVATMAVMSVAVRMRNGVPRWVEYVAGASFWIYLMHHPLMGLIHIDLKWLVPNLSPAIKAALSFGFVTVMCLVTYEAFIRQSRLGIWLGLSGETVKPATISVAPEQDSEPQNEIRRAA